MTIFIFSGDSSLRLLNFFLVAELINSVIEFVMDAYYKNKYSRLCKFAKDIAAGAVLLCAISSAIIAAILLVPRFVNIIKPYI